MAILWRWLSFFNSSIKRVHSSIFSLLALPEGTINKFVFHFMASLYFEETSCSRSTMEKIHQTFVFGCTVISWTVILLLFAFGLNFFWCWVEPQTVLKFLLHVAHKVVSCLVESLFLWTSSFFGCLFVDCSLFFCWSSVFIRTDLWI